MIHKVIFINLNDGKPYDRKLSRTVWSGGKDRDNIKILPITISLIPGEVRDNLAVRVGCGRLKPSASMMMFDSNVGQRVHASPPGGMYVQIHGTGNMGQGFFAPNDWIDNYWEEHGLFDKEEKPGEEVVKDLDDTMKKADKEFVEYWDKDMEALHQAGDEVYDLQEEGEEQKAGAGEED